MSLKERLKEIKRIWGGAPQEIRYTAVGWDPDLNQEHPEGYQEDCKPTPSGNREYYKVISKPKKGKRP